MAEPRKPAVPLAAVVIGGLLAGAGLFGLFRGASAEPVPADTLPPVKLGEPRPDPFGTLPVPSVPAATPPVTPAGGIVPAPLTPLTPVDAPPTRPADTLPVPKPADPVTLPPLPDAKPMDTLPVPKPLDPVTLPPVSEQKPAEKPLDALPAPKPVDPVPPKPADTLLPVPGIEPVVPKPTALPQPPQPVKPGDLSAPVPPVKPENVLRPEPSPLTVKPVDPVGPETLPPPRKAGNEELPPPRPVVEQTSLPPIPVTGGGELIATPTTPGLTPMPVSRTAVLSALIGAAVSAAPAFAADPPAAPDPKALEAIQKQIDDLKADVTLLKNQKKALEEQLFGRGDGKTATTDAEKGVVKRLKDAEDAGKKMADQIKELETKLAQKSVSEKQPLGGGTAITPGKGLVKLVNEYNVKVSMMVNGTSYPLEKNEVREVLVPEGELKYELVEFPNAVGKTTNIKEGETVTLRIK